MRTHGDLFAGIGGFSLGFAAAGFDTRWHVQWEPKDKKQAAQQVLRRQWPQTPLFGDVRECGAHNLEPVDVITFGSPCQDLSTAGKRKGLEGDRSVLFYEALRIVGELKPALAVWENVDGALSSHHGRDFASVLLAFQELGARDIGWTVLNAQYFGVPQRRRRVFVVADFRGERAAEILFEPECLSRDLATRRKAGQGVAAALTAGSATGSGVNRPGRRLEDDVNIVAALTANGVGTCGADDNQAQAGHLLAPTLTAHHGRYNGGDEQRVVHPLVSHALTAEGADASEDGTGRGTPLVVLPILEATSRQRLSGEGSAGIGKDGDPMFTLQASQQNGVAILPFDPAQLTSGENRSNPQAGDPAPTLHASFGGPAIAFNWQQGDDSKHNASGKGRSWVTRAGDYAGSVRTSAQDAVAGAFGVRRLTPRECERLQGFPDDFTAVGDDGKPISDSARYRALGNAVAVPVVAWLAQRMAAVLSESAS